MKIGDIVGITNFESDHFGLIGKIIFLLDDCQFIVRFDTGEEVPFPTKDLKCLEEK